MYMRTPVAIIIFNRPDLTERVFSAIARAQPPQLFVIADGPRSSHPADFERCAAARAVTERVDWECEVLRNYSDVNLGVGVRPATGIRWVFDQVEEAIILEDDCLPDPTFFQYCDELLEKYRDDERIMHISGDNWGFAQVHQTSYFFSCYCYSCGWATWRRAFQYYDPSVNLWPKLRETDWLSEILRDPNTIEFWKHKFDLVYTRGIERTGWDWPWLFACWANRGLSILPARNLISNLGFRPDASSSSNPNDARASFPVSAMEFPLAHPDCMVRNSDAERTIVEQFGVRVEPQDLYHHFRRTVLSSLPGPVRERLRSVREGVASRLSARTSTTS